MKARKKIDPITEKKAVQNVSTPGAKVRGLKTPAAGRSSMRQQLAQREYELALINSIQMSLASKMDADAVYVFIGEKICEIFGAEVTLISTFDLQAGTQYFNYLRAEGKRVELTSQPMSTLARSIAESGLPLLLDKHTPAPVVTSVSVKIGHHSTLVVPFMNGSAVGGMIGLQNISIKHAFNTSDLQLLETIAKSMGATLENARLLGQMKMLFEAEQARNKELEIINGVQELLASNLDPKTIIQLVGNKIRDTFKANTAYIALYDEAKGVIHFPYYVENDYVHENEMDTFGSGLTSHVIRTRKVLLLRSQEEQKQYGALEVLLPGKTRELNESYLGVPIFNGEKTLGAVSVQSYEKMPTPGMTRVCCPLWLIR